jgi:serine/threonine-protein kinase
MAESPSSTPSFEERLAAFSHALREGLQPTLESFLPDGPERGEALVELVHVELEYRLKQGQPARVEDYVARYPELSGRALASLVEAELRLRLRQDPALDAAAERGRRFPELTALDTSQASSSEGAEPAHAPAPPCRYRRQALHASGGLGVVYRASDEELGREVALKEIQERHAQNPRLQMRFVFEAEVTGRLEHPAIVPIYGQGRYPDGKPYYAMRFIQGETLAEAIASFHQAKGTSGDPPERMAQLRALLGRFLTVCQAVAYAHSRGVLHRDIKPANIMLGAFGETFLVDWGLSRVSEGCEQALHPGPTGQAETMQGATVGTPAYMSPEQARGLQDQVGPRSDIYSLGATLYHILSGQPPFGGGDAQAALERAARAEFARPRQLKPWIPQALEAVCLKALAQRAEDRYGTAQELAADVDRWLADEPVSAYREPLTVRLRRWGRRHRLLVSGGVVALLVSVVALAVGLTAVEAEQRQTAWERDRAIGAEKQARQHLARAEKNLALARKAVGDCFGVAKDHPLLQREEMKAVKKLLLETALPFYQNFQAQRPNDPGTEEDLADQFFQVGYITSELGREEEALNAFDQARARCEVLVATQPKVLQHRYNLAAALNHMGRLLWERGRRDQALQAHRQALNHQRQLVRARPENDQWQAAVNCTLGDLAGLLASGGDRAGGLKALREVLRTQRKLADAHPKVITYQVTLAQALHGVSKLLAADGQTAKAIPMLRQARTIQTRLIKVERERAQQHASRLAETLNWLSLLLVREGQRPEAMQIRQETLDLLEALVKAQPDSDDHRFDLAGCLSNFAQLLAAEGKTEEAEKKYRRALDLLRPLVQRQPGVTRFAEYLSNVLTNLGTLLREEEPISEALAAYTEARALMEALHQADRRSARFRQGLALTLTNRSDLLLRAGQKDEAVQSCRRAVGLLRELIKEVPGDPEYSAALVGTLNGLGLAQASKGERQFALKSHTEAETILRQLLSTPNASPIRAVLAATLERIALLHAEEGNLPKAIEGYTRTCELAQSLRKAEPKDPSHQYRLAHASLELGVLHARRNDLDKARLAFTRARDVGEPLVIAYPKAIDYRHNLGRTYYNLGKLFAMKERSEAAKANEKACELFENLGKERPESGDFPNALGQTLVNMANLLVTDKEPSEALAILARAKAIQQKLVVKYPTRMGYRLDLARASFNRAALHVRAGDFANARDDLTVVIDQTTVIAKTQGHSPDSRKFLMLASFWRAEALARLHKYRETMPDWDRALELAPPAMRQEPLFGRAECLAHVGEYRRALEEARVLAKSSSTGRRWYGLARIAGLSYRTAAADPKLAGIEREQFTSGVARLAITWLEAAERAGFFKDEANRRRLQADPALAGLRVRTDIQRLLERLQGKSE